MQKIKNLFSFLTPSGIVTREKKIRVFLTTFLACILLVVFVYPMMSKKAGWPMPYSPRSIVETKSDTRTPTIVDGKIVFPNKDKDLSYVETLNSKGLTNLSVLTANLIAVFDQSAEPKITAIRILGETKNINQSSFVNAFKPVVKFIDADNKVTSQKIGTYSDQFNFVGLAPNETTLYDVTIPVIGEQLTDKLEIIFNSETSATASAYEAIKIQDRNFEVKTASNSATGETIQYYSVNGSLVNTFSDYLTDITVTAWVKDKDGLVFSVGRQFFKNDLISPGNKLEFKIPLLPLKNGFKYESYELSAYGKLFKIN